VNFWIGGSSVTYRNYDRGLGKGLLPQSARVPATQGVREDWTWQTVQPLMSKRQQ